MQYNKDLCPWYFYCVWNYENDLGLGRWLYSVGKGASQVWRPKLESSEPTQRQDIQTGHIVRAPGTPSLHPVDGRERRRLLRISWACLAGVCHRKMTETPPTKVECEGHLTLSFDLSQYVLAHVCPYLHTSMYMHACTCGCIYTNMTERQTVRIWFKEWGKLFATSLMIH